MSRTLELGLGLVSLLMAIGMVVMVPWYIGRLPSDYFVRPPPRHPLPVRLARNLGGFVLIVLGIVLLVLPGQGVITILIGLSLLDLPIKHRAMMWLLHQPKIRDGVQGLRAKLGKPPLVIPDDTSTIAQHFAR